MSFGQNLLFLRKMHTAMTQEELAEKMNVSRQTVSKWESDGAYPEMDKALALCKIFNCTLDDLMQADLSCCSEAYGDFRTCNVEPMRYVRYAVLSEMPEDDANQHITSWAHSVGIAQPQIIGWDFPYLSQEQINVFHMHGYASACILPDGFDGDCAGAQVICQPAQRYAVVTIREPFRAPFTIIPNGYKALMRYMNVNGLEHKEDPNVIACYEKVYNDGDTTFMDVYIAIV